MTNQPGRFQSNQRCTGNPVYQVPSKFVKSSQPGNVYKQANGNEQDDFLLPVHNSTMNNFKNTSIVMRSRVIFFKNLV